MRRGGLAQIASRNEYDKTIAETEAAYMKILESSQTLLNVLNAVRRWRRCLVPKGSRRRGQCPRLAPLQIRLRKRK